MRRVRVDPFWIDALCRLERRFARVRRRDRTRDRGRALRLVVRLRRPPPGRLPAHPRAWRTPPGGGRSRAPTGAARRARSRTSPGAPTTRSCTSAGTTPRPTAPGPGRGYPTEAEWEYAARGGLDGSRFPWGDELEPGGEHRMNVWQGAFPRENTVRRRVLRHLPGRTPSRRTATACYNITGNVWEWCADWFHPTSTPATPGRIRRAASRDPPMTRGGSYLCHDSYCARYRVAARNSMSPDSTTGNTGFRCCRGAILGGF